MGLFGELLSAVEQNAVAPANADSAIHQGLIEHVLGMAANGQTGGLGGLVEKLNNAGLASQVSSWVGGGPNQGASADQIHSALGGEMINELSQKFGIPPALVAGHLSQILPEVVNHLTPGGAVPHAAAVDSAIGLLRGKLFD